MKLNAICRAAPSTAASPKICCAWGSQTQGGGWQCSSCRSTDPHLHAAKRALLQQSNSRLRNCNRKAQFQASPFLLLISGGLMWLGMVGELWSPTAVGESSEGRKSLRPKPFLHPSGAKWGCFICKSMSISSFSFAVKQSPALGRSPPPASLVAAYFYASACAARAEHT